MADVETRVTPTLGRLAASVVAAGLAARFAALRLLGERGDDVDGDAYYPPAWVQ